MTDSKRVLCETCAHNEVCRYKDDYMDVLEAIKNTSVNKYCSDGKVSIKPISSYDFINDIPVACKYYRNR